MSRFFSSVVLVTALAISMPGFGYAHSLGEGSTDLTPPMIAYAEEVATMKQQFGSGGEVLRGVFNELNLWNAGSTLQVCFYDGEPSLKDFFVRTASRWLSGTSLRVDFGTGNEFRVCRDNSNLDIRISFAGKGYWSFIGTDSILPEVVAKGPSLNVETKGIPFDHLNLKSLEEKILHEFGHALGLLHEHQSPVANCADQMDWPAIFAYAKKYWGWDEDTVKTNFEQYISEPRLRTTPYDKNSIMHYALAAWMYKSGEDSRCYVTEPRTMSTLDRTTIQSAYPGAIAAQDNELQRRVAVAADKMTELDLDNDQIAVAATQMSTALTHVDHPVRFELALADNDVTVRGPRRPKPGPCGPRISKINSRSSVTCGASPDGSKLVIEINPRQVQHP
jgi:hypothetical protein